jgi:thiol-disulfide isomerase/thioredoxin
MIVSLLAWAALTAEPAPKPVEIGTVVDGQLAFRDIRYLRRTFDDLGQPKAVVLAFCNNTCPLVQRYWPALKELEATYRNRGVRFLAVNVAAGETLREVARQAVDFDVPFAFVKDEEGRIARAVGVTHTPQVVVLDARRRLVYRGRIDDRIRLGGERPRATRADLQAALDDVLAGKPVQIAETPVDGCAIAFPTTAPPQPVDFARDVAPIVKRHCQECHRANGSAPFSLTSVKDIVGHAATLAEVVADERMPPWYGSRRAHFRNDRALSDAERRVLLDWVRAGAAVGDLANLPEPLPPAPTGWTIGEPDRVVEMLGVHRLPASGFIDYKYLALPFVFPHDTWVEGVEIAADNPKPLHHCNLGYFKLGGDVRRPTFVTGKVPGGQALILREGVAFRFPAGAMLGLQAHYTSTGKPETVKLKVGLRYARGTVRKELKHLQIANTRFTIPPHAPFHAVSAKRTLPTDATVVGMFAHMHLRGRDMTFVATPPQGPARELLCIPNYNFDWQQAYEYAPADAPRLPKGTVVSCTAHFDNSTFNPFNPDATAEVPEGQQTIHEMCYGFFFYVDAHEDLQLSVDTKTGAAVRKTGK